MTTTKFATALLIITLLALETSLAQDTLKVEHVDAILYTGKGKSQPLVVGLGGAEGGNAWATDHWKNRRDEFLAKGYAFLAVGYFGGKNTPKILDRIAIENVHNAILAAKKHININPKQVAVIGGSRGADLALLLGSYYKDISCVIAMSASHVAFPGHTQDFATSCWTYQGLELPFVPVNDASIPFLMKKDLHGAFKTMLQDTLAEKNSRIKVENINGAILLLTGKADEIIPASEMAEKMVDQLKKANFKHTFQHLAFEGSHAEPTQHFDRIFEFLGKNFALH